MMTTSNIIKGKNLNNGEMQETLFHKEFLGIYVHIPFCVRKCHYCDFPSFESSQFHTHNDYIRRLVEEIRSNKDTEARTDSIFIGGGTPSAIDENFIKEIMEELFESFRVTKDAEITIEANPCTLTEKKLVSYRKAGINRISIGVQSFNDENLKTLGRLHKAEDAGKAFYRARKAGFENINLDLMFAYPNHDLKSWSKTLEKAVRLDPEHLSFYSLQLEEGTELFERYMNNQVEMPSEECDRAMYHEAVNFLTNHGYEHYEISNCAKAGKACKHNLKYWNLDNYLGIGLGAHSFMNGIRWSNTKDLKTYINGNIKNREHSNSFFDNVSDYMITALRLADGIDLEKFRNRFGKDLFEIYEREIPKIEYYKEQGLLELTENRLRITRRGIDISNKILEEFV